MTMFPHAVIVGLDELIAMLAVAFMLGGCAGVLVLALAANGGRR